MTDPASSGCPWIRAEDTQYRYLRPCFLFNHRHRGPEFDDTAGELRDINDFGTRELVFQLGNTSLVYFLLCLGGLIFRILSQVGIVGDRFLNPLNEARSPMTAGRVPLDALA